MSNLTQVNEWIDNAIPHMHGWSPADKCKRMAKAIFDTNAELSVELGIFAGRGILSMAVAHRAINRGVAWGCDPWRVQECLEGHNDPLNDEWWAKLDFLEIYRGFIAWIESHQLRPWCGWHRWRSDEIVSLYKDGTIDVLHIDSNHSEEVSCKEVIQWLPKMKPSGVIFFDDTQWETTKKAQSILAESGWRMTENHTEWGVFQRV